MATYWTQLKESLETEDWMRSVKIAQAAFSDPSAGEMDLEPVAGLIGEANIQPAYPLIQQFVKRFPNSMGLPRVFWSGLCLDIGRPDEAIHHARFYLRMARDRKLFDRLEQMKIICNGVTRAFANLAAGYALAGARSYAARVIAQGMPYKLQAALRPMLQEDLDRYIDELTQSPFDSLDEMWEGFFLRGANAAGVAAHCKKEGFPDLARRVDLLEARFRYDPSFHVPPEEIYQLAAQDKAGTWSLA